MSDDDFGTMNLRRGDRTREIEVLQKHRESLVKMLEDVDQQLREFELAPPALPVAPQRPAPQHPARRGVVDTPLVDAPREYDDGSVAQPGSGMRVAAIIAAAVLALALIGYLIWRASSDRPATTETVVEETTATADTATVEETATIAPASPVLLAATPVTRDYGLVRKGTRITRQYEVANNSEEPMSLVVSRSQCRCLYYEHAPVVPPRAKESITVTIDGAKAKAGELKETIRVSAKSDPAVSTSFEVIATVR